MKALPSIAFNDFLGTAKDVTARHFRGRTVLTVRPFPSKVVSSSQKTNRNAMSKISRAFKKLTFERDGQKNVLKPRWQLISTHTARRSAITNMYLSGKYTTPQIMSVSGHHNEDVFWEYVKLSLDEKAEQVFLFSADGMF